MTKGLLFFGGFSIATFGVYQYYIRQISFLKKSDISLLSVRLISQTKSKVVIRFDLQVINKSEQEFTIKSFESLVYFNSDLVGKVSANDINKTILPNGGKSLISFDFSLKPKEIGLTDILAGLISNRLKSNLSLEGRMKIKKGFVTLDAPVKINYKLNELF